MNTRALQSHNPGATVKPLSAVIREVAVLAAVQATSLGLNRLDRTASSDSDARHNAMKGTAKVNVNRMPGAEKRIDQIKAKQREGRQLLLSYTTPFGTDRHLLNNSMIGEFSGLFGDIQRDHDALVQKLHADAPALIKSAGMNLGSYAVTPPSKDEVENAFSLDFDLTPVPDVQNFTCSDKELERALKERFEDDIRANYQNAIADAMKRVAAPLEHLIKRMQKYNEREELQNKNIDVGREGTFTSTVVTNITDLARTFRSFNLTDDPVLTQIANDLESFGAVDAIDLKRSKELRNDTAQRASKIRESLSTWLD